ncbi:MAG: hypothetical protein QG589_497 [Patescibacteria group bacterium]|nr:hypothetical protein [Patescibacteria group bacterium]
MNEENNLDTSTPPSDHIEVTSPEQKVRLKSLRTYEGDVAEAISETGASISTIAVAEQKRKIEEPETTIPIGESPDSGIKNKIFGFVGITLLTLSLLIIGGVYYTISEQNKKVDVSKQTTLITFSQQIEVPVDNLTHESFAQAIREKTKNFAQPVNSILYLSLTKNSTSTPPIGEIISLIDPQTPGILARSLDSKYMIGIYSFNTNEPFIILTTKNYPQTYAGMLDWEQSMIRNLGGIFNFSLYASTTPLAFQDEEIRNKDVRILKNENQKTVLLYSFLNRNTFIITSNEAIFNAILGKFMTSQTIR